MPDIVFVLGSLVFVLVRIQMQRILLLLLIVLAGCGGAAQPEIRASLDVIDAVNAGDAAGFARATAPRPFVFPADHGPHPTYRTEWWYYTGNLTSATGRHFGFQFTIFRQALSPEPVQRASDWATHTMYLGHLALTDVVGEQFYAYDRLSRGAAGLAGATGDPFRVFLEDWSVTGSGPEGMQMHLRAAEGEIALDLTLASSKPPVLQGEQGLSRKGSAVGNASFYYSLTRMATSGTIRVAGQSYTVQGLSWMDHEFGTSALDDDAVGWDWFAVQLDSGWDLMFARIRQADGSTSPFSHGSLIAPDGTTRHLDADDLQIEALDTWRSPHSGATYPARWRLTLPEAELSLELVPYLADQELPTNIIYWEGAVQISGTQGGQPVQGSGYVELTGYVTAQPGRF
jgi:predicted secreted hydrolase